jgi:hypothetical protein
MFISGHHRIRIQLFFWMWTPQLTFFSRVLLLLIFREVLFERILLCLNKTHNHLLFFLFTTHSFRHSLLNHNETYVFSRNIDFIYSRYVTNKLFLLNFSLKYEMMKMISCNFIYIYRLIFYLFNCSSLYCYQHNQCLHK